MAFPTTSVIETFTGANGTSPPNSNWTNIYNTVAIQSNRAAPVTLDDIGIAGWDTATFGADSEVYMTIPSVPAGNDGSCFLFLRGTTLSITTVDGYIAGVDRTTATDTLTLEELLNGGTTALSSTTQNVSAGDKIGLEAIGTALKMYYCPSGGSWTQKISTSDGTYTSAGYIGLGIYNSGAGVYMSGDDFGGGTVVAVSGLSIPVAMANFRQRRN
jgi:hypothetical protein